MGRLARFLHGIALKIRQQKPNGVAMGENRHGASLVLRRDFADSAQYPLQYLPGRFGALDVPFGKFRDKGQPLDNVSNFDATKEENLLIEAISTLKGHKLIFGTKHSMLKMVDGGEFDVAKRTTAATKLAEDDEVLSVFVLQPEDTLVMQSEKDVFLRIDAATIPEKKKGAVGVRGMKLEKGDSLCAIHVIRPGENETVKVKGKTIALNRLHIGNRDTKGVKK